MILQYMIGTVALGAFSADILEIKEHLIRKTPEVLARLETDVTNADRVSRFISKCNDLAFFSWNERSTQAKAAKNVHKKELNNLGTR
jgi:hypothetical protein